MKKLPYLSHLSDNECKNFFETYADHNASMGLERRINYTLSDIERVERNVEENCLNVYYRNGDWWHYTPNRTWY